ncbi:MAG: MFS transporter [Promethearchaeota archaeon]
MTQNEISASDKITKSTKTTYGLISLGSQTVNGVFAASLIFYYTEKMLLPQIYIIWAFALYAIWNAINDPLFGWLSDKTKTRWGRRIPYLMLFTPVMTISFIFLWLSPTIDEIGELGVFFYLLLTMSIYDTAFTAALLAYSALGQELSMDHRERASLQVYSMIFGVIGTLAAMLLPSLFFEGPGREGFIMLTIILGIVQFIAMGIGSFTIKERLEFSHVEEPFGLIDSLKHTLKSKSFIITVLMNFCLVFIQAVFFGNLFFYTYYAIPEYDSTLILMLVVLLILAGIAFGIIYILKVNEKKGVKTALIYSIFSQGVGFILIGVLPGILAIIGFFFVGIGLYGTMTLFNVAYGQVIDEDEVKTGKRREAAVMGINALITKPAQSVAGAFIAFILLVFLYQEPIGGIQQPQAPITLLGIKIAMGIIPGLISLLGILIFKMYPLHGEYLKKINTKMYEMHDEKMEKYQAQISKKIDK